MKFSPISIYCLALILLLPLNSFSHDFASEHKVENWRDEIPVTVEDIHDLIWEEAWEVFTGDDGEECDAEVWGIKIDKFYSPNHFELSFVA